MARTKPPGSIIGASGKYYLQMMVQGKRYQRAIRDELGAVVTTRPQAERHRQATAVEIRKQHSGISTDRMPLDSIAETYLEHLPNYSKKGRLHVDATARTRISPRTLRSTLNYMRNCTDWFRANRPKVTTLQDIDKAEASAFMATKADLKPSSYNRQLMALRHVWQVIPYGGNPFSEIKPRSAVEVQDSTSPHRAFTPEQLLIMQERATGWFRPAMLIGYHAGLRLGDVATLMWEEIGADGFIHRTQRKTGKRELIYCPEAMPALEEWRRETGMPSEYVFPVQANDYLGITCKSPGVLPGRRFIKFLKRVCGIDVRDKHGRTVLGFHSLRTSNATYGRRAGEDMEAIQKRLAHSSERTTNGYLDLSAEDIKRELKRSHVPLALPGSIAPVDDDSAPMRERLAALAWTAPADQIRNLLKALEQGQAPSLEEDTGALRRKAL